MSNVVDFAGVTSLDTTAARVLTKLADALPQSCVVAGFDCEGKFYFASSVADGSQANWLLDVAKKKLLEAAGA